MACVDQEKEPRERTKRIRNVITLGLKGSATDQKTQEPNLVISFISLPVCPEI